jgi:cytochrome c-type biogenesis protein CcmH
VTGYLRQTRFLRLFAASLMTLAALEFSLAALGQRLTGVAMSGVAIAAVTAKTTVDETSEALTCQCGCGLTVANCNHPQCSFSVPLRTQIERMIARGMTRAQIVSFFRAQYGEKILSAPTPQGFNLLAWLMPFAALIGGGVLIFLSLGRWRSPAHAPAGPASEAVVFDSELRRRLERDLKERN